MRNEAQIQWAQWRRNANQLAILKAKKKELTISKRESLYRVFEVLGTSFYIMGAFMEKLNYQNLKDGMFVFFRNSRYFNTKYFAAFIGLEGLNVLDHLLGTTSSRLEMK